MSAAQKAVDRLIRDLAGRRGLKSEWERIDDDVKREIRKTWIAIVEGATEGKS